MVGRLLLTEVGRLLAKVVGDPKSEMLVGKAARRVVEEVCEVGSLGSSVAVDGSDSSSALDVGVEEDKVRVEALVEEALVVATGIEELRGPLFVQSLALSSHTYPRSQHRPDRQMGPPLQDPPLHTG